MVTINAIKFIILYSFVKNNTINLFIIRSLISANIRHSSLESMQFEHKESPLHLSQDFDF